MTFLEFRDYSNRRGATRRWRKIPLELEMKRRTKSQKGHLGCDREPSRTTDVVGKCPPLEETADSMSELEDFFDDLHCSRSFEFRI